MDDDEPVRLPLQDTLDLHTFHPRDVGSVVPEWLAACREAGMLDVCVVHGKGTGVQRARVRTMLDRSPLVRAIHDDGNWGRVTATLWDPATDEARIRAVVEASPRAMAALRVLAREGPPGAWLGAGAVRNRAWHAWHGLAGEPDDRDLDAVWHGPGDAAEDARIAARLRAALDAPWEVVDQARYGAASAEAGIARWPETATAVAARWRDGVELFAAHGWADLVGMVVRPTPGFPAEAFRARLATKRWRERFPWVRIERD